MGVRPRSRRGRRPRRHGAAARGRAGPACDRTGAALPRWLRLHGGVRHPALLPPREGLAARARGAPRRVPASGRSPVWSGVMDFAPSPSAERFRAEVREVIAEHFTDEVRDRVHQTGTIHSWPLHQAIGDRGWIAQALPEAQGGGGRGPEELAALFAELERAGAPYDGLSNVVMVSSVLAHVGNDMIRGEVLPRLLSGEAMVCLGYTEPDSGSDVAAARTRATRDGDGWRIDGQKMFTSVAEEADWIFLLTRTSTEGPKHAGLTFFLVPMDTPGITLQEVRTLPGKRVNITFLDGVRIGDEWRVGEVDGGWDVMLVALSFERGLAGGVRDGERLLAVLEDFAGRPSVHDGTRPIDDPVVRQRLVRLAIDN